MIKEARQKSGSKRKELNLKLDEFKKSALTLRALNHKLRQKILMLIHKNENITVSEIYNKLKLEQSVASAHLAILRKSGFVSIQRDGHYIYYSVNYDRIEQVEDSVTDMNKSY